MQPVWANRAHAASGLQTKRQLFLRTERATILCFSCASRMFARVELTTLFGTWWGIIGYWLGPLYIVHNLVEYIIATFRFVRSEKYVRKGLLRLCVAAGITWIGWLGYKALHALAHGSGWLSSIVWLILIVSISGPILIAWVVAGFQKSAAHPGPGTAS